MVTRLRVLGGSRGGNCWERRGERGGWGHSSDSAARVRGLDGFPCLFPRLNARLNERGYGSCVGYAGAGTATQVQMKPATVVCTERNIGMHIRGDRRGRPSSTGRYPGVLLIAAAAKRLDRVVRLQSEGRERFPSRGPDRRAA